MASLVTPIQGIHSAVTWTTPKEALQLAGPIADGRTYVTTVRRDQLTDALELFMADVWLMMILCGDPLALWSCRHVIPHFVRRKM